MKPSLRTRLLSAVLVLLSWTAVHAQIGLGDSKLLDPPAPTLRGPRHLKINLRGRGFVGRVGGVAFGGKAKPSPATTFTNLSLSYRPEEKDGRRLWVTVDGREFPAQVYDWQMVPIAKFANSDYKSCVTLFGELNRRTDREKLTSQDSVINYHPEITDTLLGLRIFHLDILINYPEAIHLPTRRGGAYILGEGETRPDIAANEKGWDAVEALRSRLSSELKVSTDSYVITDDGRDTRFDFEGGSLRLTGEPYIYFWRYKGDLPDYSLLAAYVKAASDVNKAVASSPPADLRREYTSLLLKQLSKPDLDYEGEIMSPTVETLLAKADAPDRSAYIETLSTDALRDATIDLSVLADLRTVTPLKEYTERLSSDTKLLRSINPAVWDTGVNVMRYAAFFRYVKENHPEQWKSFHARVSRVRPRPVVTTPTVLRRPEE